MQLAIAVALFCLGYWAALHLAAKPNKGRKDLVEFLDQVGTLISGIRIKTPPPSRQVSPTRFEHSPDEKLLYTKDEVEETFDTDSWQRLAYDDFRSTVLAKGAGLRTFPCVYATMGYRSNDHRYVFMKSHNPAEPRNIRILAPALRQYLEVSKSLGPNTSLVIVCGLPDKDYTVEDYNQHFWDMLRGLRISDSEPWPAAIPQETHDAKWTFCFYGEPLFPVSLTPAHQRRWSRHMSVPVIALQPKWVLDNLLGTPEKREAAQSKVRKLLKDYDQIEISPDLTSYGDRGTTEAKQLCLLDENESVEIPYSNFDE